MSCSSSFNGIIDEIPHISVDNFTISRKVYFLSHCHTDHTEGFRELPKDDISIYTSEINVKIMEYEMNSIANYMSPMKVGCPETITLPSVPEENLEEMYVRVTLIPAGHCLGSTMILFETNNKSVLYTGDFRLSSNDIVKFRDFHTPPDYKVPLHIDVMYVDTTFYNRHEDFPKRTESIVHLIRVIKDWLQGDNNKVAIRTSAKYGYEHVFKEIYKNLGRKVYVGDRKWELYSQLKEVTGVTNDSKDTDIHNCSRNRGINKQHTMCIPSYGENYNFLYINLSAMRWNNYNPDEIPMERDNNTVQICFATHCSKSELKYFINYFSPKKIVGFPNRYMATPTKPVEKIVFSPVKKLKCRKRKVPFNM